METFYGFPIEPITPFIDPPPLQVGYLPLGHAYPYIDIDASIGASYAVPKMARSLCRIYETLAAVPNTGVIPASGQYLQELEVANVELQQVEANLQNWSLYGYSKWGLVGSSDGALITAPGTELWDSYPVLSDFNEPCPSTPHYVATVEYVRYPLPNASVRFANLVRGARRLLRQKRRSVKRSLFQSVPRFCSLGWSRRLWFLLHGSHPPKASASYSA